MTNYEQIPQELRERYGNEIKKGFFRILTSNFTVTKRILSDELGSEC